MLDILNIKKLPVKIESEESYTENLRVLRMRLPENSGFSFVPGQFVMLSVPGLTDKNGRPVAKSYSIASSPLDSGIVELCIVKYESGMLSPHVFKAQIGDELTITGPYGIFQLKRPVAPGTVFVAGGTGIAPLISMIRFLYKEGYKDKLWLFYSVSEPSMFLFKDELLGYQKNNGLRLVVSTSSNDSDWQWDKGRVTDTLPRYVSQLNGASKELQQFYVCGSPVMVADTVKMLVELGFKKENIHKEQW